MAVIRGYIAASLDGYIAAPGDQLDWLHAYDGMDLGEHDYHHFLAKIRTVVMGRTTYDVVVASGASWPYTEQRAIVVTSRPIPEPLGPLETRSEVDALIAELRALDDGDVWMVGGGRLQMAFLERGALDELEVYVLPELLGGGVPLFPPTGLRRSATLVSATALDRGCARLHYRFT